MFTTNAADARFRPTCEARLGQLFHDSDASVRAAAAACFRRFSGPALGDYPQLVDAFVNSSAFAEHQYDLLHALEGTTARLPEVTYLACERFMELAGAAVRDFSRRLAADARTVGKLVVRVYSHPKDATVRIRCLNLVDSMAQAGTYRVREILDIYDR